MRRFILIIYINIFPSFGLASSCQGRFVNPLQDVCWTCILPITIGSANVTHSGLPDTLNPPSPVCSCGTPVPRIGLAVGFWEPNALVDITRTPFCMTGLGGIQLTHAKHYAQGGHSYHRDGQRESFYHTHWYIYPVLSLLNLVTDLACADKPDFDVAWMSELDPFWDDDDWSFVVNPESALFSSIEAQGACAADAIKTLSPKSAPIDKLFWCMGSHGSVYPLNGHNPNHIGGVQSSVLLAERTTYRLHRFGLLQDFDGSSSEALCHKHYHYLLPKSRYRYQMTFPVPQSREPYGCRAFGHTTQSFESGREFPVKGEDYGYFIWRKVNCCAI